MTDQLGSSGSADDPLLAGLYVLVVEDDPDTRAMFAAVLRLFGAYAHVVASARDAMRILQQFTPDVIVADIALPEEDGYSLIQAIRTLDPKHGGRIPALAVTALGAIATRERSLAAGFQEHLEKPVDGNVLAATVARLAGARKGRSA